MKRLLTALVLLASTFSVFSLSGNCTRFYMLGYSNKGEIVPARLCAVPEPGVYVEPEIVGSKLAQSLHIAYMAFNHRHGPLEFGVILDVEGPYTYIDGRSADLSMYVALYSLISGKRPPLATGSIEDDLYTIRGVAYVREKLNAATGPVIIPYSNRDEISDESLVIPVKNLDELDAVLSSLPS